MALRKKRANTANNTKSKKVNEELTADDSGPIEDLRNEETGVNEEIIDNQCILKWVIPEEHGIIPDNAVEGGWLHSSKLPLYIARIKVHNGLLIGCISALKDECEYVVNCQYINHSRYFEVLVNLGSSSALKWVEVQAGSIPPNAFVCSYLDGKPLYVGRHKIGKKDMYVGYVDSSVGALHLIEDYRTQSYDEFEMLVVQGSVEIIEEIDHYTLDDIDYNLGEAKTSKVPVILDEVVLQNRSSTNQKLKSRSFFEIETNAYCWKILNSDVTETMTEIGGKIPVTNTEGNLIIDFLSYPEPNGCSVNFADITPKMFGDFQNGTVNVVFDKRNSNPVNPPLVSQFVTGQNTIIIKMKLGERLVSCTKHDEVIECNVPPKTEVKVKVQAMKDVLEVPFTAHLRKVYKNGMTAEEDVRGTFTSETTAHIMSIITEENSCI